MAKGSNIIVRVSEEFKDRLAATAERQGVTMTDLILAATAAELARLDAGGGADVPAFYDVHPDFRYVCQLAATGGLPMGRGYESPGWDFAHCLDTRFAPPQYLAGPEPDPRWLKITAQFWSVLDDRDKALAWMKLYRPGYLALVPARRRDAFLGGVRQYVARTREGHDDKKRTR